MARSLGYLIDKSLQVGRVTWEMECRAQDLEFRRKEKEKFLIQNNRRHVLARATQLRAVTILSATLSGFSFTVLTNLPIPETLPTEVLMLLAVTSSTGICSFLLAVLGSMYTLIGICKYKYDPQNLETSFVRFWESSCAQHWRKTVQAFSLGLLMFFSLLAIVSWVHSYNYITNSSIRTPIASICTTICIVTVIALCTMFAWKWGRYIYFR